MTNSLINSDRETLVKGISQQTYDRAKTLIPGGTQLLSKRPEMFLPDFWPAYYSKSKGCRVWDLDGKEYVDAAYMGVGANVLGYCDDDVDNAVIDEIRKGTNTTLNSVLEVKLAEKLIALHPWSDMVRYTKTGGEAMTVAVRIARAYTKKEKVLFCGYHGWHDWYLSTNLSGDESLNGHLLPGLDPAGVAQSLKNTSFPFKYNDSESFEELLLSHKGEISCIVIESVRNFEPNKEFFENIRRKALEQGIVLILDEITAGFRLNIGGAHLRYGIEPDIAVFGKAMSNGYPLAAIIGKRKYMQAAQNSFISSLFWTESLGLAATIATIEKMIKIDSPQHVSQIGTKVKGFWESTFKKGSLKVNITGLPAILSFGIEHENALILKTLFTQEMLKRGFLATTAFYASCAHELELINYFHAFEEVFSWLCNLENSKDKLEDYLMGPVCHAGFKRLT